jgi:hypothetical protein
MRAICTPVTPLCLPTSRLTGISAGASCGTFVHSIRYLLRMNGREEGSVAPFAQGDITSARSLADTRGSFLASAYRHLSVALVQSQGYVYRSWAPLLAQASERQVLPGADIPFLD